MIPRNEAGGLQRIAIDSPVLAGRAELEHVGGPGGRGCARSADDDVCSTDGDRLAELVARGKRAGRQDAVLQAPLGSIVGIDIRPALVIGIRRSDHRRVPAKADGAAETASCRPGQGGGKLVPGAPGRRGIEIRLVRTRCAGDGVGAAHADRCPEPLIGIAEELGGLRPLPVAPLENIGRTRPARFVARPHDKGVAVQSHAGSELVERLDVRRLQRRGLQAPLLGAGVEGVNEHGAAVVVVARADGHCVAGNGNAGSNLRFGVRGGCQHVADRRPGGAALAEIVEIARVAGPDHIEPVPDD